MIRYCKRCEAMLKSWNSGDICYRCKHAIEKEDSHKIAVIIGCVQGVEMSDDVRLMRGNKMPLVSFKDFCQDNSFDGVIVDVNGIRHVVRNNEVVKMEEVTE